VPELPEVETVRRALADRLQGRKIEAATLHRRDVLVMPGDPAGGWSRARQKPTPKRHRGFDLLAGATVASLRRRGKQLAWVADSGRTLLFHLGMSGRLLWLPPGARCQSVHVHAVWRIAGGGRVVFIDPRRFGGLWALPSLESLEARWSVLGPDARSITAAALSAALSGSSRPIKAALLDQAAIAGLGNIYADEALFEARLHPGTPCTRLSSAQIATLAEAIRGVLEAALAAKGSTLRDYATIDGDAGGYQAFHRVYGRAGAPCVRCGGRLSTGVIAQRTTVWCDACQPKNQKL